MIQEGGTSLKNLKLKAARAAKDLSQEQLAQLVGVTRQTIGMIEAGKYNPTLNFKTYFNILLSEALKCV